LICHEGTKAQSFFVSSEFGKFKQIFQSLISQSLAKNFKKALRLRGFARLKNLREINSLQSTKNLEP